MDDKVFDLLEKLNCMEDKLDNISNKVEKQDVEIRVIKGAK